MGRSFFLTITDTDSIRNPILGIHPSTILDNPSNRLGMDNQCLLLDNHVGAILPMPKIHT